MMRFFSTRVSALFVSFFLMIAFVMQSVFPTQTIAGVEGRGGNGVVCFSIPLSEAIGNGRITKAGESHINRAITLEHYEASLVTLHALLTLLEKSSSKTIDHILKERLTFAPVFFSELLSGGQSLPSIEEGEQQSLGLVSIQDSGFNGHLPDGCVLMQTVIRNGLSFSYDPVIWKNFSVLDRALMQLHENIYYLATQRGQTNSIATQYVLKKLLSDEVTEDNFAQNLAEAGFGSYSSLTNNLILRSILLQESKKMSLLFALLNTSCSTSSHLDLDQVTEKTITDLQCYLNYQGWDSSVDSSQPHPILQQAHEALRSLIFLVNDNQSCSPFSQDNVVQSKIILDMIQAFPNNISTLTF